MGYMIEMAPSSTRKYGICDYLSLRRSRIHCDSKPRGHVIIMIAVALLPFCTGTVSAQSLTSMTSLVTIPVADVPADGTVSIGGGIINRKYVDYLDGRYHITPYFVSVAYFPFLEVSLRFSRPVGQTGIGQDLGDRMISVRLQLLREAGTRPALLVGLHDIVSTTAPRFNALYLVASKHIGSAAVTGPIGIHLGYGTDWYKARHHEFVGLFGGLSISPLSFLDLLLEYDGDIPTGGARLKVFGRLQLLAAMQNFDTFAGGATLSFTL